MRRRELQKQQQQERSRFSKWVFYVDPRNREEQNRQPLDQRQHQLRLAQTQSAPIDAWTRSDSDTAVVGRNYSSAGFIDIFLSKRHRDEAFRFFCNMTMEDRRIFFHRLYELVSRHVMQHTLDTQLLLSVMQFNVIRAAAINASSIGLGMDAMSEDIISPFNNSDALLLPALPPTTGGAVRYGNELQDIPPHLQPTALQRLVIHHPWIDLCPQPSLRDALLRRLHDDFDEDEFCHHMFLQCNQSDEDGMIGMVVWGEAWDPASYEISATMIRKWPWLVDECPEIIRTANYWRARRHEGPLKIL